MYRDLCVCVCVCVCVHVHIEREGDLFEGIGSCDCRGLVNPKSDGGGWQLDTQGIVEI